MPSEVTQQKNTALLSGDRQAIEHLASAIQAGESWFIALLEAINLWHSPAEVYKRKRYRYIIGGEAFDWLMLAQRLLDTVASMVPQEEVNDLLFKNRFPMELSRSEFRRLIGAAKYRAHLNYFYGVEVEQALEFAVETEVRKERHASGWRTMSGVEDEAFERVYGCKKEGLFRMFQAEKGFPRDGCLNLDELKEFTYWLFHYRLAKSEKERFASDTRKGLNLLHHPRATL
ncbi:MAG: hypothetical protein HYY29_01115 [Chloroflexi bacterium]|nr:hypothetical protein [Chloroflexota bacterium]